MKFEVTTEKAPLTLGVPASRMAQIVFIQDENQFVMPFSSATVRYGMDGLWSGATKGRSYFIANMGPGVHHLCANWQSVARKDADALFFTAEAGKTCNFSASVTVELKRVITFSFSQLNEDQTRYRLKTTKLSRFTSR